MEKHPDIGRAEARRLFPLETLGTCEVCAEVPAIDRHHIDGNTFNNGRSNLKFVCRKCHSRIHHAGRAVPEAVREKISDANRRRYADPEARAKQSETIRGYFADPEARKRHSEALTGRTLSDDHRASLSEGQRRRFADPAARTEQSERLRRRYEDLELRAKASAARRGKKNSDEMRAKQSESMKAYWAKRRAAQAGDGGQQT